MVVLMHGVGSNEQSMSALAAALDPRLLVLNVRSPLVLGPDAYAFFHVTFTPDGPVINRDEAEAGWRLLAAFIDDAVRTYGADPAQVFVAGFSQGGIMALATMLTNPGRLAGAVVMSGRLLPEVLPHAALPEALAGKPVLIVHGTKDKTLSIDFARWAHGQLARFPLALTYVELDIGHSVTLETVSVLTSWMSDRLDGVAPRA
jgi:phospholipase/carboxylesterase